MELSEVPSGVHFTGLTGTSIADRIPVLLASASFWMVSVDSQGIVTFTSAADRRLETQLPEVGLPLQEALGLREEVVAALEGALGGEAQMRLEHWNEAVWILHAHALPAHQGGGAVLLGLDIAPVLQELAVDDRERALVLSELALSTWTVDDTLQLIHGAGPLLEAIQGDHPSLLGVSILELVDADDPWALAHRQALSGSASSFCYDAGGRSYSVMLTPVREGPSAIGGVMGLAVDITEQVRQLEHTRKTEKRLREAQYLAHVGTWEWDLSSDRIEWSEELHLIFGLKPGTFPGTLEAYLDRVHPDDRAYTRATVLQASRTLQPYSYEHRCVRPDGSVRMLHSQGEVVEGQGKTVRMLGCCWDVTEAWQTRLHLEHSVSLLRATLESTTDGFLVVDIAGNIRVMNERFVEIWNIPQEVAQSRDDARLLASVTGQLLHPESFLDRVEELYAQPEMESFDVLQFKDGRVFERYSRPQRLGSEVIGRVWSFRDVTTRDRLLRRAIFLAEAGRLLGTLDVEHAVEAVGQLGVPLLGDVVALDLREESGMRRVFLSALRADDRILPHHPSSVLAGASTLYEVGGRSYMGIPLRSPEAVLGVLTLCAAKERTYSREDLTFAQEVAQRLALALDNARLYRRANVALKTRDEFLSIAAHELRRPATALRLALQSLRQEGLPRERIERLLEMADRQARQMDTFIDELLDVARIRADRLHLELEEVELAEVARDIGSRMSAELAKAGSPLSVQSHGDTRGVWDLMRLEQLIGNLLSNAIKFGNGKPIAITVRREGDHVNLQVKDRGIGIPPEKVEAIFRPFERAVSSRHFGGLGLGLYICQSVVRALGGTIRADSRVGEGTTMQVQLPVRRPNGSTKE